MLFKINLAMVSILAIVLFFNVPFYNNWLNSNLLNPQMSIAEQSNHISIEERKIARFGGSYTMCRDIIAAYKTAKIDSDVLLMPPDAYLKKEKITEFTPMEPCIFYYFTGHIAVWYDSPDVEKANCALVPGPGHHVILRRLKDKDDLHQLLAIYKTYKLDL